ncbi:MAG TPA: response regulator [Candidatus Limnocylindrales bacterium]|nr:response regulator [Candidatus Limnocylindrales bacterium]
MPAHIILISGDPKHSEKLTTILSDCGLRSVPCATLDAAANLFSTQHPDVAICDDTVPDGDFRKLIAGMKRRGHSAPVIVVSRFDDWGSYLEAMVAGAFDYVAYPPYPHELERAVGSALAESRSQRKAALQAAA